MGFVPCVLQCFPKDPNLSDGLLTPSGKWEVGRGDANGPILAVFCRSGHAFNSIHPGLTPRLGWVVDVL